MEVLAAIVASLSVMLLAAYGARTVVLRPDDRRLRMLTPLRNASIENAGDAAILRRGASSIPVVSRLLDRRGYAVRWSMDLERAAVTLRPGEYLLIRVIFGAVAFAIVFLIGRDPLFLVCGAVAGVVGFMLPAFWLASKVGRRTKNIEAQLVETITLISNAQRAGFAFAQGMDVAAKRMGAPISVEINRLLLDINMGASTEDALLAMNERVRSEDLDLVVTAILIQRQTGGNLAEVLENVSEIMRDRERIKGEIKTMTSTQRMSGWVLSCWPVILGLLFIAINPGMMSLLWTTQAGFVLLGVWAVLQTLGVLTIRRILAIDI